MRNQFATAEPAVEAGGVVVRGGSDLHRRYARSFTTIRADTERLREQFFKLRYQVYCVENAFEDAASQTDQMERDEFDTHSACSLLVHRATGVIAGGIRLILPFKGVMARDLPLWRVCDRATLESYSRYVPRERTGEVSRDAISKQFRRMIASLGESGAQDPQHVMRNLSLGSMAAIVRMAKEHGITHICATMEAPMLRMLARLGIHFQKLGPTVEFHGVRQPAYADLDALLARTWAERPDVWALLTGDGRDWPLNQHLADAAVEMSWSRLAL